MKVAFSTRGLSLLILPCLIIFFTTSILLWLLKNSATAYADTETCNVPTAAHPSIQQAIDDDSCDVIHLTDAYYLETVVISRTVTIQGEGIENTTVDGNWQDGVFTIEGEIAVSLADMSIINGQDGQEGDFGDDKKGGGVEIRHSAVVINNVLFQANSAIEGGGLYSESGVVTITNSIFNNNWAADGDGGAILNEYGDMLIQGVVVQDNDANWGGGGGVESYMGTVYIIDSTFDHNEADWGGGVSTRLGTIAVTGSTFINNRADFGNAVYNFGILTLENSTLSDNHFRGFGSGVGTDVIYNSDGLVRIANSTLYGNGEIYNHDADSIMEIMGSIIEPREPYPACEGFAVTSLGHNIATDDTCNLTAVGDIPDTNPLLGPLRDNGGPTWTHALEENSPAIDAGSNVACPDTDQRGIPRPQDGDGNGVAVCDIGAYELLKSPSTPTATSTATPTPTNTPTPTPTNTPTLMPTDTPTTTPTNTPTATSTTISPGFHRLMLPVVVNQLSSTTPTSSPVFAPN